MDMEYLSIKFLKISAMLYCFQGRNSVLYLLNSEYFIFSDAIGDEIIYWLHFWVHC